MYRKYLVLIFLSFLIGCTSQRLPESNAEYAVSPLLLLKSDHSVVQGYNAKLQINSTEHATYHIRKVTTVLSADARDNGEHILPYGGFQDIVHVEGALYNKDGELIKRLNKNDGRDFSLSSGYTLYQDTRIKSYELYHNDYPYTVVFEYEIELNGLLNLPDFYPQSRNEYVESARLEVRSPQNLKLKHRALHISNKVDRRAEGQDSVFVWQMKDLKPLEKEPYGKSFVEVTPRVLLATEHFRMADTEGELDSWNSFGRWYYRLSEGRNELPESTKREVSAIFDNASDRKQGIKDLYEYMQNKTRYVSIQLGIGGWQPFEAMYVEEKGYGDCKALTNYMQAILNYVGVEAYPVLIKNGTGIPDIVTDFPSSQFNHVILWVPEEDTIWLESTSQTIPFNYIGYSNSDRHGLAVTPDSSFLIKTPVYDYRTNKMNSKYEFVLDIDGNAKISIQRSYSGYYLDKLLGNIAKKSDSGREKWAHEQFLLNSFELESADFSDIDKRKKEPVLSFEILNSRFASKTGSRLFIPVQKLGKWEKEFPEMKNKRNQDVDLIYSFRNESNSTIRLPDGYEVEAIPEPDEIKTDFGNYSMNIISNGNGEIEISRVLEIRKRIVAANKYEELRNFYTRVNENDSKNIVLVSS